MQGGLQAWSGTRGDQDLAKIEAPTLVLVGGADLLTPDGEALAQAIPGARALVVDRAGHALGIEEPDAVIEAIAKHLAAVDEAGAGA